MPSNHRTRPSFLIRVGRLITAFLILCLSAAAQAELGTGAPQREKSGPEIHFDNPKADQTPPASISNDRLFYTLPNFLTVESPSNLRPLRAQQKFKVVARTSFDYVEYPWYAFRASISQAQDNEPSYGQGAAGYAKRYALTFADCTFENFMVGAVLPSLLRQDPRFYRSGHGTVLHRTGYAVSRIFVTRTDSGREQFNYSEIVGSALAAGVSTYSYHPAGGSQSSQRCGAMGNTNQLPHLHHRHERILARPPPNNLPQAKPRRAHRSVPTLTEHRQKTLAPRCHDPLVGASHD